LPALAAGRLSVGHGEGLVRAGGGDERGVRLFVVPLVGVAPPGAAGIVEDLRLQPAAAGGIAAFRFQRHGPGQHAVLRKNTLPL